MREFHVQTIDSVSGQIVYVMADVTVQINLMKKIVKVTTQLEIQESKLVFSFLRNVRENKRSNHEWITQRHWQHWVHKMHDEDKQNKKLNI